MFTEDDLVAHRDFPGVVWKVFEVTQIGTVTLLLHSQPEDFVPTNRFDFEVVKSGELVDPDKLMLFVKVSSRV